MLGLDRNVVLLFSLLLTSDYIIEGGRVLTSSTLRPTAKPHHQANVKRKRIVQARKMALGVQISEICYDPPSISVGRDVPDFVRHAQNHFLFHPFNMLDRFVFCLRLDVIGDISFAVRIAFDAIAAELFSRNRSRVPLILSPPSRPDVSLTTLRSPAAPLTVMR